MHILFVDAEKYHLSAMKRSFRLDQKNWTVSLADDAVAALRTILEKPVDVMVTETHLPGMDGLELLEVVRQRFPRIIRIVLSGHVDRDVVLKSVGIAHQYLTKPCDDKKLKETIKRAYMMRKFLPDETLNALVSRISALPSLPRLYVEINQELSLEDPSIAKVADIVSQDPSVTAKLLQLVNSSFFGMPQTITEPMKAVNLLGLDLVQAIVLASGVFATFKEVTQAGFSVNKLWEHSFRTGAMAKLIAQSLNMEQKILHDTYLAGLLHDLGVVLMAAHLPDTYVAAMKLAQSEDIPIFESEKSIIGASHAELGGYLLGLWGLDDSIILTAAYHHHPRHCGIQDLIPLTFVHAANVLDNAAPTASAEPKDLRYLDWDYLEKLELTDKVAQWHEMFRKHIS